jgi:hypothetical protein
MSYCGRLFVCSFAHVLVCSLARPLLKNRLISAMSSLALRTHYYEETFFGRRSVGYPCFWHSPMILQFIHSPLEPRTQSQQMGDDMSKLNDVVKERAVAYQWPRQVGNAALRFDCPGHFHNSQRLLRRPTRSRLSARRLHIIMYRNNIPKPWQRQ